MLKGFIATGTLLLTSSFAAANSTADNAVFIVRMKSGIVAEQCFKAICEHAEQYGNGYCEVISRRSKIAAVNLTTFGAEQVVKLDCVDGLRREGSFGSRPGSEISN